MKNNRYCLLLKLLFSKRSKEKQPVEKPISPLKKVLLEEALGLPLDLPPELLQVLSALPGRFYHVNQGLELALKLETWEKEILPVLRRALHTAPKEQVRLNICYMLTFLGTQADTLEAITALHQLLHSQDEWIRIIACKLGSYLGQMDLFPDLLACLDLASEGFCRQEVFISVSEMAAVSKNVEMITPVLNWSIAYLEARQGRFQHPDWSDTDLDRGEYNCMIAVVKGLGELKDPRALPVLQKIKDRDGYDFCLSTFGQVAVSRASAGTETGVEMVLNDIHHEIGGAGLSIRLLADMQTPKATQALVALVDDLKLFSEDRLWAIYLLGEKKVKEAVPTLLAQARQGRAEGRAIPIEALGKIGDVKSVPDLINYLDDKTLMDTQQMGGTFHIYRDMRNRKVCDIAAEALRKIGTPGALEALNKKI